MAGELSFFELGTGDYERARAFYTEIFGWEFDAIEGGARISTPTVPGGIHPNDAGASPYVFFAVDDLDAAIAKVNELGGSGEAMDESPDTVAEFGRFALCKDDQGSSFGLHQRPA
jgi:predicted enzyme related to lactoylglutathione lyase